MSPDPLNQQGPSIQDQNHQLVCAPYNNNHDSTSLSCCTFFDIYDQREIGDIRDNLRHHDQEDDKRAYNGGGSSSTYQVVMYNNNNNNNSSCLVSSPHEPVMADPSSSACDHNLSLYKIEREENKSSYGSVRCLPPKIRLTRKIMSSTNPSSSYNTNNSITRVCSDCNTSSTPLWRSGPNGPKTLCNACGIRQRKARKAMAEAANGFAASMDASRKIRVQHKEKKCRATNFGKFKNKCKATTTSTTAEGTSQVERKLHFKGFAFSLRSNSAIQLLGDEEVAEAALLLMDLSCGFVHF
ncbi:hypothetical protein RIF29_12575 [Crotalaria pallida]|uniref:GATA-type domain-containing protein n=1 Tax=Crotalaria pallida TaxID=3830 RepID=A0AAN9P131_CROPI